MNYISAGTKAKQRVINIFFFRAAILTFPHNLSRLLFVEFSEVTMHRMSRGPAKLVLIKSDGRLGRPS